MCLHTIDKCVQGIVAPKPKCNPQPIKVFKVLKQHSDGSLKTPYQNFKMEPGQTYTAALGITPGYAIGQPASVNQGLHAYRTLQDAKSRESGNGRVYSATIPAYSEYLEGINGDIVATKLTIDPLPKKRGRGRPKGVKDSYKRTRRTRAAIKTAKKRRK